MKVTWKPLAAAGGAIVLLVGIIAAASGSSGAQSADAPDGVAGAVAAWKAAGLTVSDFKAADARALGGACQAGTVGGVDVTVCRYADAGHAKAAVGGGFDAVGEATGTSLAQGSMLLVVADRHKADPQGRTINTIAKTFEGK